MKIIFLGYAVSKKEAGQCSGVSVAGNNMQLGLLEALEPLCDELKAVTIYPVSAWPKDAKRRYKKETIDLGFMESTRVGFRNLPVIKQRQQGRHAYRECLSYLRENPDAVLVTFNMYPQTGYAANKLRKQGYKVVPLLADLPIDDNYNRRGISKLVMNSFFRKTARYISRVDRVIALNKHAAEVYAPNAEYMVMDGAVAKSSIEPISPRNNTIKNIVYGGSLNDYSGIKELIEAMRLVKNKEVVLEIYGSGDAAEYIKQKACSTIRFGGKILPEEMRKVQRNAWVLVNPRNPEDPIAQVTFPSKTFEYMISGRPTLSTRLNGFTEEYEDKLYFADSNEPHILAIAIDKVAAMSEKELDDTAKRAYEFVVNERTWDVQAKRIVEFLSKV